MSDSRDRRLRAHNEIGDSALAQPPAGLPASYEQYKSGAHRSARHTPDFLTRIHYTGPAEMAARTVALILALTTAASALTDAAQNLYGSQQSFRFTAQASFSLCRYGRTDIERDLLYAGFPTQPPHWQGGIRIVTEGGKKISVHGFSDESRTSDSFTALSCDGMSTRFFNRYEYTSSSVQRPRVRQRPAGIQHVRLHSAADAARSDVRTNLLSSRLPLGRPVI